VSRVANKLIAAAAGAGDEAVYVDNVFSTSVYTAGGTTLESHDATALSFDDKTTAFTDNGNKTIGWDGSSEVRIHSLSTKYDLSTASSHSTTSSLSNTGGEYYMTQDGTKMYNNPGSGTVYQYSLSSAFDLSTASLVNSKSGFSTGGTASVGLLMKDDGTKLITQFGGSSTTSRFEEWTLSTAYDITTASLQNTTAAQIDGGYVTTAISADGHYLYWLGSRADVLAQFFLPTAWSVAGAIYVGNVYYVPYTGSVAVGLTIGGDDSDILWAGNNTNGYYKFQTNFDVSYIHRLFGFSKQATDIDFLTDSPKFLIWGKSRSLSGDNHLIDSETGIENYVESNTTNASATGSTVGSLSTSGYGRIRTGLIDGGTTDYVSWTFRKQPGFFDVVTYTGTGSAQTINHSLGSAPGMIIVKDLNVAYNWMVYHRSLGGYNYYLHLNTTDGRFNNSSVWQSEPTNSTFSVGHSWNNNNGSNYVAYLFAHDAQDFGTDSDESIIKCGSYTGNGSTDGPEINLGFEPQWVLIKNTAAAGWIVADNMRGMAVGDYDPYLRPNASDAEYTTYDWIHPTATGFKLTQTGSSLNSNGDTYIYMAIRRPNKPASEFAATDLFSMDAAGQTSNPAFVSNGHVVDMAFEKTPLSTGAPLFFSRLTGQKYLNSTSTVAEATGSSILWDYMSGCLDGFGGASSYQAWMFRRAPGFFDVVAYTGQSAEMSVSHNLGVTPELIIQKCRTQGTGYNWNSWYTGLTNSQYINLNTTAAVGSSSNIWGTNSTVATDSIFRVGAATTGVNGGSSNTHIAYLFASVDGISKVGTYTGNGTNGHVIDCGFSNGVRFVLIKMTNGTGNWYLFDSVRGITSSLDNYILLNQTAAQTTDSGADVGPNSSGFTVSGNDVNKNNDTFLFLAIA
jgi:hypothetical protein